uniref:Putative ovule protein n=1 Tax=Solanum chacoense TaxID=4108 RepID=A0A0V0GNB7_SOLCH
MYYTLQKASLNMLSAKYKRFICMFTELTIIPAANADAQWQHLFCDCMRKTHSSVPKVALRQCLWHQLCPLGNYHAIKK